MPSTPDWKAVSPRLAFLQWAPTHEAGTVMARDLRDPDSEALVHGKDAFAHWVADHSQNAAYVPVGEWIANGTKALGITKCAPCAKRQALLNSLFPKFR